jgi:hypothetical protein
MQAKLAAAANPSLKILIGNGLFHLNRCYIELHCRMLSFQVALVLEGESSLKQELLQG